MFFEDRSVPLDKVMRDLFSNNLIDRLDRVYQAMEAAGVRPISDVVRGIVDERANLQEDEKLKEIVKNRARLIEHVSKDAINLENIDFICAEELKVRWHTDTFRNYSTPPELISAHLDKDTLYFTLDENNKPWPAIARELTKAITHGEEIVSIAPAIMIILGIISHSKQGGTAKAEPPQDLRQADFKLSHYRPIRSPRNHRSPATIGEASPFECRLTSDSLCCLPSGAHPERHHVYRRRPT